MQLLKSQNSTEKEPSIEHEREKRSVSRSKEDEKTARCKEDRSSTKDDVKFLMQVCIIIQFIRVIFFLC